MEHVSSAIESEATPAARGPSEPIGTSIGQTPRLARASGAIGDPRTERSFSERVTRKVPAVSAAIPCADRTGFAAFGSIAGAPDPDSLRWEIGSITKMLTGILPAEMSLRGEVGHDDPIGRHLPDTTAARMPALEQQPTLEDPAAHTSGLPRIPRRRLQRLKNSRDPYSRLTESDVWEVPGPRTVRPRRRRSLYSNYGAGLLGICWDVRPGPRTRIW
jgi:CubicO group peptidase (beta-lactamase class C family)